MRLFNSDGSMPESLLTFLSVDSVKDLRVAQEKGSIWREECKISDVCVLTMAGMKILSEFFANDRKLWSLVEKKARKFFIQNSGLDKNVKETNVAATVVFKTMYTEFKMS